MLSFPTNLATELRDRFTAPYWYIRLYYGDETNFTGLSDKDRILDSVKYRGLILDWGTLIHSVDLNSFKSSVMAMNGLTINNATDQVSAGAFSDLFLTQNYVNRKFTLHMGADSVAYADHAQIAQGIITDQIDQSFDTLTLSLLEDVSAVSVEVPKTRVNTTDHPNAPTTNIGKPIPMAFGDFGVKLGIGTVPSGNAQFDRYFTKGMFPAIITDKWDSTNSNVEASPDTVALHTLNDHHVGMAVDGLFPVCDDVDADVVAATPIITFKGSTWRIYIPLGDHNSYSGQTGYANGTDGSFSTLFNVGDKAAHDTVFGWKLGKVRKLGGLTSVKVLCNLSNFVGTAPNPVSNTNGFQIESDTSQTNESAITWGGGDQSIDITGWFSATKQTDWDLETDILMEVQDFGAQAEVDCYQVGVEITFTPSQTFIKEYVDTETFTVAAGTWWQSQGTRSVIRERLHAQVSEYIYYSGKGRKYGAWVDADSRANGYNSGDLIGNPVYMIEEILRTELTLTSSEIDYATFDTAGNSTDGTITNIFNLSVGSIEFAFCQYKFIDAWVLCQEIASSCGCFLFKSGDGKIKIKARQRDEDYTTADRTIKYDEINNIKPGFTPLSVVRNKVTVNYALNYATDSTTAITAIATDATSQGSGANGIGGATDKVQELVADNRFTLDSGTATGYSTALLDWLAYRKKTLEFDVQTPKHNDLEIGDTILFSGWSGLFKIYGNTIGSTDIYMITQIRKTPYGCTINAQEVSEVGD